MPQDVIQMYAATTGGAENALATIDIPQDGVIEGVNFACRGDLDADGDAFALALSFASTSNFAANDGRGTIAMVATQAAAITAAGTQTGQINHYVPMDLEVSGGERLYLHSTATASVAWVCNVHLYFRGGGSSRRRSRRLTG